METYSKIMLINSNGEQFDISNYNAILTDLSSEVINYIKSIELQKLKYVFKTNANCNEYFAIGCKLIAIQEMQELCKNYEEYDDCYIIGNDIPEKWGDINVMSHKAIELYTFINLMKIF